MNNLSLLMLTNRIRATQTLILIAWIISCKEVKSQATIQSKQLTCSFEVGETWYVDTTQSSNENFIVYDEDRTSSFRIIRDTSKLYLSALDKLELLETFLADAGYFRISQLDSTLLSPRWIKKELDSTGISEIAFDVYYFQKGETYFAEYITIYKRLMDFYITILIFPSEMYIERHEELMLPMLTFKIDSN